MITPCKVWFVSHLYLAESSQAAILRHRVIIPHPLQLEIIGLSICYDVANLYANKQPAHEFWDFLVYNLSYNLNCRIDFA